MAKRLPIIRYSTQDEVLPADKGEPARFDNVDIEHNGNTYILESRYCDTLVRPFSAIVIKEDVTANG